MSDKLKDKLNQTDKDNVVQNTATNEAVKQTAKMKPQEQLAIAEPAVKEELQVAQEKGEIDQKQAAQVYNNLAENKNQGDSLTKQFTSALKFLMPQMVGAAVGGLAGGDSRSALGGAELAGQAAKGYRDEIREEKRLGLAQQRLQNFGLQGTRNIVHADSGTPLTRTPEGFYVDPDGNKVPAAKVFHLGYGRLGQGAQRIEQGDKRIDLSRDKFAFSKAQKDEMSDKQVEALTQYDFALDAVNRINDLIPGVSTGPISSRVNALKQYIDTSPESYNRLRTETIDSLAQYIRSISGAQASDREREFLEDSFPTITDPPGVFLDKLNQLDKRVRERRYRFIDNISTLQGKKTPSATNTRKAPKKLKEKTVTKRQYSPSRDKTRIIYSDGTAEIIDGRQ